MPLGTSVETSRPTPHGTESADLIAPGTTVRHPWVDALEFTEFGEYFVQPNRPLEGKPVVILGGGPGLTQQIAFDLSSRANIAVNNSYKIVPAGTVVVAQDRRWYEWHKSSLKGRNHVLVCAIRPNGEPSMPPGTVHHMEKQREHDMPTRRCSLTGNNSGQAAACLAYLMGATRIYLAGFDMGFAPGDKSHWHGGHPVPPSQANYVTRFRPRIEAFTREMAKVGVQVSAITTTYADIPTTPLQTALDDLDDAHGMDHPEAPTTVPE